MGKKKYPKEIKSNIAAQKDQKQEVDSVFGM